MSKIAPFILIFSAISITACSALAPEPTATPTTTATNTPLPTATFTLTPEPTPTSTFEPTDTPVPQIDPTQAQNNDSGLDETPVAEWRGVPIMPEAIAAHSGSVAYFYNVDVSIEEIFEFYEREMAALGYPYLGYTETTSGSTIFAYDMEERTVTITVAVQDDGTNLILIF